MLTRILQNSLPSEVPVSLLAVIRWPFPSSGACPRSFSWSPSSVLRGSSGGLRPLTLQISSPHLMSLPQLGSDNPGPSPILRSTDEQP